MPVVYVSDMAASTRFYELLGLTVETRGRSGAWTELRGGGALVALHTANPAGPRPRGQGAARVELAFVAGEPLEELQSRLEAAGAPLIQRVSDESFGRSLIVCDPDGLEIQVNEHDQELYT